MRINNSDGRCNYSQRNNEFYMKIGEAEMKASCMCNVSSYCQSWDLLHEDEFPEGKYKQPEDNFCEFICTNPDVDAYYKKLNPSYYADWKAGKKDSWWPNEIHAVLAYGFNKWIGRDVAVFYEALPLRDFMNYLYEGKTMPTSMTFGKLGHIVSVVGFQNGMSETEFKSYLQGRATLPLDTTIFIDDTYGYCYDFEKGLYKAETGNDRTMTLGQFIAYSKPLREEKVMCHILS